jgi:diketogulonate reductase-like aldo/keto reductase
MDDRDLPPLIYGTAWKKERTADLVERAVVYGFLGIDTACQPKHYHEMGVGQALESLKRRGVTRESLFLQTKFTPLSGQDPLRIPYNPAASITEQVHQSCTVSLGNLGTDYLDALLLHSPLPTHNQTMEAWGALEQLHQQGIIRRLGISNCYELDALKRIFDEALIKPAIVQNRFYDATGYDREIRNWCGENQIRYQSFWTLTANPQIIGHSLVRKMASDKAVTPEQLFFRFLTQKHVIPLIGACSERHMQEDLAIFAFALTDDEIRIIDQLLSC